MRRRLLLNKKSGGNVFLENLVASYAFDGNVNDRTGNHNGTPTDMSYISGIVNDCADFNGSTSYFDTDISSDFSFTDGVNDIPFSISFWYRTVYTGTRMILVKRDASNFEWDFYTHSTVINFRVASGSPSNTLHRQFSSITNNQWYHFVGTYDGSGSISGFKFYQDTVGDGSDASSGTYTGMTESSTPLRVGTYYNDSFDFDGQLDELHIWKNRVLTQSEINEIYATELAGDSIFD